MRYRVHFDSQMETYVFEDPFGKRVKLIGSDTFEKPYPPLPSPYNIYYHWDDGNLWYWKPEKEGYLEKINGGWYGVRWLEGFGWQYYDPLIENWIRPFSLENRGR